MAELAKSTPARSLDARVDYHFPNVRGGRGGSVLGVILVVGFLACCFGSYGGGGCSIPSYGTGLRRGVRIHNEVLTTINKGNVNGEGSDDADNYGNRES
jgi:hypothetical protein